MGTSEAVLETALKGNTPGAGKSRPVAPLPSLAFASNELIDEIAPAQRPENTYYRDSQSSNSTPTISVQSTPDPISLSPSSPPQIYLNLLILESSLRAQYLTLLTRRRLNTFFLFLLACWIAEFTYLLFFRPREDDSGRLGGSPYWVIETFIRLGFIGGIVAALLVKATGQWDRGVKWPRRWLSTTNRGLRGFNLRVVIVRQSYWDFAISYVKALAPIDIADGSGDWHLVASSSPDHSHTSSNSHLGDDYTKNSQIPQRTQTITEEDLSPSGGHIHLLLQPKHFSSEFRENWETYRAEYWERENIRRANLREKVVAQRYNKAKAVGGWKWWSGAWRIIPQASRRQSPTKGQGDLEKHLGGHHARSDSKPRYGHNRPGTSKREEGSVAGSRTHSRNSSRAGTPVHMNPHSFDGGYDADNAAHVLSVEEKRIRRGSSVSSTSSVRRSLRSYANAQRERGLLSPLTLSDEIDTGVEVKKERKRRSRPGTPSHGSAESVNSVEEERVKVKQEEP